MKVTTKIAAVTLMAVTSVCYAQQVRKEVILETGKGGIELKLSVPDLPISGPMDFSGNPGISKFDNNYKGRIVTDRQVLFSTKLGNTGYAFYKARVSKASSKNIDDEGFTNKSVAESLLKSQGLKFSEAHVLEGKPDLISGNSNATYKICAKPVFEKTKNEFDCSIVSTSVTKDRLQALGIMSLIIEEDVQAFNSNPEKYDRRVEKAFDDMMSNSKARMLP